MLYEDEWPTEEGNVADITSSRNSDTIFGSCSSTEDDVMELDGELADELIRGHFLNSRDDEADFADTIDEVENE